ncbi:type II toxin-antitoxin system VapC family toxin [Ornithinimicrobium faecis]|uniref:Ribonuclease VapC n=1 Tax=Ornithinimicrobium faecis TaxID=2934158 RepID=A0ABY4YRL7_9MICO|nr:type II toxin-antitoxin system VapC family toxin [Ornithinimicrobium sp. HY1793]USQ78935.1 type II toxin-antitoxin system VapC family toxin [Ornithinimicrobium sp. HY1793]
MIVDSSAIVAILLAEAERDAFVEAVRSTPHLAMSAVSYTEAGVVLDGRSRAVLSRQYDVLLEELGVIVVDVTAGQARSAREAYRDFGRRSGHRARLNFGDCFSYALATARDEPLLFKGDGFGHTDVRRAV